MKRHAILVGLPGSGKTMVGRLLRQRHPAEVPDFTDLDEDIERRAGHLIAEIFARSGEAEFRRLEREAMDRALERPPHLIAAGGGWIAGPGNLEAARAAGALVVHLRVSPELAALRLAGDTTRPLLGAGEPLPRLRQLFEERRTWYAQASAEVDAGGPVEGVAAAVRALMEAG